MRGTNGSEIEGLSIPIDEDFDPNIQFDNLTPKTPPASSIDVKLWAQTVSIVIYSIFNSNHLHHLLKQCISQQQTTLVRDQIMTKKSYYYVKKLYN